MDVLSQQGSSPQSGRSWERQWSTQMFPGMCWKIPTSVYRVYRILCSPAFLLNNFLVLSELNKHLSSKDEREQRQKEKARQKSCKLHGGSELAMAAFPQVCGSIHLIYHLTLASCSSFQQHQDKRKEEKMRSLILTWWPVAHLRSWELSRSRCIQLTRICLVYLFFSLGFYIHDVYQPE